MTSQFYKNQRVQEFAEYGSIEFSNDDLLPELEAEFQLRKLDYRVVCGLGEYGVTIAICKPEKHQYYKNRLNYEVDRTEKILAIKKAAQSDGVE